MAENDLKEIVRQGKGRPKGKNETPQHKASFLIPETMWRSVYEIAKLKSKLDQKYIKPSDIFRRAVEEYLAKRA